MSKNYRPNEHARRQIAAIMEKTGLSDLDALAAAIGIMELIVDVQSEGKQVGIMGSNPAETLPNLVGSGPEVLKEWRIVR